MLAFDTETTGLLRPEATEISLQPYIIELYIAKFDDEFKVYDEFETFLKPPVPLPEEITKITGIDEQMLADAPEFIEIYDDLCELVLGERSIFAHNCSFDISMLRNELYRHGLDYQFPWPKNHYCTVELSKPIKNKRMKLAELYKMATGKEIINAHRAKNDVLPTIECIKFLKDEGFL